MEERKKRTWPLPSIHSESAPDASGGRPTELRGGDITQDPSLPYSPPHQDQAFTNENVNHGVYTNEAKNYPKDDSEQSVTQSVQLSVGEIDRHSVPYDTGHTQE